MTVGSDSRLNILITQGISDEISSTNNVGADIARNFFNRDSGGICADYFRYEYS